ncbi:MAG: double-strand break repair protein AddB, partial [Pseudomonadota bacterium]
MSSFFELTKGKVYSIPPGVNFLQALAQVLADETGLYDDPEALADALIYVPNRRSERALAFALHEVSGHQACLLPDIRALGDLETDEPPPSAEMALADLPPVISPAKRIGGLTRLTMRFFERSGASLPAAACLAAARELARLLDQAALSGDVDWSSLEALVPERQLAEHWRQSVQFLKIITDQWPAQLEEITAMDPYARRLAAAQALVREWQAQPPQSPVIIAGSTGATPASRLLMQAALELPKGVIVLPGLDLELSDKSQVAIARTPSHPQFALVRTLEALKVESQRVQTWPHVSETAKQGARHRLLHQALAPAQSTADWTDRLAAIAPDQDAASLVRQALSGLALIEAVDDTEEALLAALLLRETLEHEGETAALVTPDAGLARHVSAMLKRWDIDVAPSAGQPLPQTNAGSFLLLVANWLLDMSHPVNLMAVLNHHDCRFDRAAILALDKHFLRGPRRWQSWPELVQFVEQASDPDRRNRTRYSAQDIAGVPLLLKDLSAAIERVGDTPLHSVSGAAWLETLAGIAGDIATAPRPWSGEDGAALSSLMR